MANSSSANTNVSFGNNSMDIDTTGNPSTFMAEVETFLTYKIAVYINQYWFPILVPMGLVGNTLSILVMIKPNNRKVSTCIYMAAISINDNLMMCFALYNWLFSVVKMHEGIILGCKLAAYLVNFYLQCSTYQVLAMTVDKYIAIKWPHRASIHSTPRRTRTISCVVILCTLCYNIPHIFASDLIGDQCLVYIVGGLLTKVYSWITFVINGIIPFSMLMHMNFIIVKTVRSSRKMFRTNAVSKVTEKGQGQETKQKSNETKSNEECRKSINYYVAIGYFVIYNSSNTSIYQICLLNFCGKGYSI